MHLSSRAAQRAGVLKHITFTLVFDIFDISVNPMNMLAGSYNIINKQFSGHRKFQSYRFAPNWYRDCINNSIFGNTKFHKNNIIKIKQKEKAQPFLA